MTATQVQAGRVDITPTRPLPLFGRAGQTGNFTAITSRLEANVLVMTQGATCAALIALDTLYPSQALHDALADRLTQAGHPLDPDAILLVASHSHNAPALDPTKPLLGQMDAGYLDFVADQIAGLLTKLLARAPQTAELHAGVAPCAASVFRRRQVWGLTLPWLSTKRLTVMVPNPAIAIDQRLHLLVWSDAAGRPLAALWHWPCHAVTEPDKATISADFPGLARQHLRSTMGQPDLPVLFLPGFSGDIRPASASLLPLLRQGRWLGLARRFQRNSTARQSRLMAQISAALDLARAQFAPVADQPLTTRRHSLPLSDLRQDMPMGFAPLTVQDWQISGLRLTAVSAEVAQSYTPQTTGLHLHSGCAGQVFGYLPTDAQVCEGGYEGGGFAAAFSLPGTFRPDFERHIRRLLPTRKPNA